MKLDLAAYDRDGFLVLRDFLPAADCDALQARAAELVAAFDPGPARTVWTALRTWILLIRESFPAAPRARHRPLHVESNVVGSPPSLSLPGKSHFRLLERRV